jgi:hypothetical protein
VRNDLDLALTLLGDLDNVGQVANTAIDLDLVLEELLEGGDVEDLVGGGLRRVDDELLRHLGLLALGGFLYSKNVFLAYCAYCFTPQPLSRRANSKAVEGTYGYWCHCWLDEVAKKWNPAPS